MVAFLYKEYAHKEHEFIAKLLNFKFFLILILLTS